MRISSSYQFDRLNTSMQRVGRTYMDAQYKVSTGRKINRLSDDSAGVETIVNLRSVKTAMAQYKTNLDRANRVFVASESAFSEVNTMLNRANQLAISGGTASVSVDQRNAMADEVKTIRDQLLKMANSKDSEGNYLFAGTRVDSAPFEVVNGAIQYNGNTIDQVVEAGPGERLSLKTADSQDFIDAYNRLDTIQNALFNGDQATLNGSALTDIQNSTKLFNNRRGELGSKMNSMKDMQTNYDRRDLDLTANLSDLEEVDLTQAITEMKKAETAYQASLQMISQGNRLNLMDFIRG